MSYIFILKKTCDLNPKEKEELRELFATVFEKPMPSRDFERKFSQSPQGYSYHGLMLHDDEIVGAYSAIPYPYQYFGREMIFALAVDTMIHPQHQGKPYSVKKMAEQVYSALKADGIPFVFGFPNQNIFDYRLKVLKWHHIGDLDYFVLPLSVGAIKPSLAWLNLLSQAWAACFIRLPGFSKDRISARHIAKVDDKTFRAHRYGSSHERFDVLGGGSCVMRLHVEDDGVRVAYIIDVTPLTTSVFKEAVKTVYAHVKNKADIIMYIGKIDFHPKGLIKVPKSLEPKPARFCGKILLQDKIDNNVLDINCWHINLSNYDVR